MNINLELGPLRLNITTGDPTPTAAAEAPEADQPEPHECPSREEEFASYSANKAATGGQFGFGRTDLTPLETPINRWETRRTPNRRLK